VRAGERRLRSWCIPDLNTKLAEWAPFHMLMMLEWLRAFKESGCRGRAHDGVVRQSSRSVSDT
jgi:hypothetical protein